MKITENINKLGTETAFKVLAEAKKLEKKGKEIIHLSLGQPDFRTPEHIIDATIKALNEGHHGYVLPNIADDPPFCRFILCVFMLYTTSAMLIPPSTATTNVNPIEAARY